MGDFPPRYAKAEQEAQNMDYADKKLLEKALDAIKNGTLIEPLKLSLRKMLKTAGLSDGYFKMVVGRIEETKEMSDLYIDSDGVEVDLLLDEKAFNRLQPILLSYIGDQTEVYANDMKWWNRQAELTNIIIESFRKVPKKYLCEYAEKFIAKDADFYKPLMKEAIKSKSIHRRVYCFFMNKIRKLDDYLCKRLAVWVFKKGMKEA